MNEVRFDRMVSSAVVERRQACNLAYLPVGSLEWHGPHMPFGTDYLTVTYIAEESARRGYLVVGYDPNFLDPDEPNGGGPAQAAGPRPRPGRCGLFSPPCRIALW